MNKEIKARWIKALRSGDYKQGRDRLKRNDTYCCLGVLCDLSVKDGIGNWNGDRFIGGAEKERVTTLPFVIGQWAGMESGEGPAIKLEKGVKVFGRSLIYYNDDEKYSFDQIADLIEENL